MPHRPSLLTVLPLTLLSACSWTQPVAQMPPPPANLAQNCPPLRKPPAVLIDPDRAEWEAEIIASYGDCAARHRLTVGAWQKAVASTEEK